MLIYYHKKEQITTLLFSLFLQCGNIKKTFDLSKEGHSMGKAAAAKVKVISSMFIYGTIGVFVRYIPLPSSVTAMMRGLIGAPFLLLVLLLRRSRPSGKEIKSNLPLLCLSGLMLGLNWILLFEAYRYTTVATATLCYYFAPIFLVAASPFVFKERMTLRKILCILAALAGMVFVSGVAENGIPSAGELRGVLLAIGAAALYACIVIANKKLKNISAYDRTIMQLAVSALVLLPYNLLSGGFAGMMLSPFICLMLLIVGVVHTGIAYYLYFGSMEELKSQTLAILSYIDPVVAVLLSALVLREPLGGPDILGAVLILGAALVSELPERERASS